ncbi:hypothetical protein FG05_10891 [Fusarium graminearum]|nr:hypothetical protein FG05_10891 [Fusarium graminearum]
MVGIYMLIASASISPYASAHAQSHQHNAQGNAPLINPLAFHTYDFVPGLKSHLLFMGTSSNWSFNRRVLTMTHERIKGTALPTHNLHFSGLEGKIFDFKWDGTRKTPGEAPDMSSLPTKDFALYLINSVKFHCGWLYSLFDEDLFMERFHRFHEHPAEYSRAEPLWFVHYILVVALGKAFVVQSTKSRRPPGGDLFIHAMKLMPDFSFFDCNIIDEMQVLCCAAIYLHSVDHIQQAHRLSTALDKSYVDKCRHMFWTIYILERQMGSLMGLPLSISDDVISAHFPAFPGQPEKLEALKIHVDFCRVLAKIDQTVYGLEGKLDSRFNRVKEWLGSHEYQLIFIFYSTKLGHLEVALMHWLQSESVMGLVQMCTESAQQILRILSSLSDQGLLETFLRFDHDATFTATIALLMAAAIDSSLLPDHSPWTQRAYAIFDEMGSRGNPVANMVASELQQLEGLLQEFLVHSDSRTLVAAQSHGTPREGLADDIDATTATIAGYNDPFNLDSGDDFGLGLSYELSAEQLLNVANSLDIDSLTWPWPEDPMVEDMEGS